MPKGQRPRAKGEMSKGQGRNDPNAKNQIGKIAIISKIQKSKRAKGPKGKRTEGPKGQKSKNRKGQNGKRAKSK